MKMNKIVFSTMLFFTIGHALYAQEVAYMSKEEAISDLDLLVNTIESVHYDAYFKTSKSDFIIQKKQMLESWKSDSVSVTQFIAVGMKISALLSNGHTSLSWQNPLLFPELMTHKFIPFKFNTNNKNEYFVSESISNKVNEGDQLISINGIKVDELFNECLSYLGGIESFKKAAVEKAFPLYLFFNESVKAPYTVELENNKKILLEKELNIQELQEFLTEENLNENYSFKILENNVGYIAYNNCLDYEAFEVFLAETFSSIHKSNIDNLIIDIRKNGGGNSSLNDLLLNYITKSDYRQSSGRYWKVSAQVKQKIKEDSLWVGFLDESFLNKYLNSEDGAIIEELEFELTTPQKVKNYFNGTTYLLIGAETFSSANFLADAVKEYKICKVIGTRLVN